MEAFAKKNGKKENNTSSNQPLTVVNNKGEKVLNGSVLDPTEDQMFILLHSVLVSILRGDLNNVSIILSSIADPSKRFIVPNNAVRLQNKKINKKNGRYLSVNLFNVKTPSGITIPPSALQKDNYKLRIVSDKNQLDVSTESFNYQTPVLIVGMVSQVNSGFVVIEDLLGNKISDNVVGLNANGSFFTEVRADMVKPTTVNKTSLRSDLKSKTPEDDISVGVIHVVSDKDLYAIAPLSNDPDVNRALTDNSFTVNKGTTLTANIAKEDENLALEVAKKELNDLKNDKEIDFGDLNCDINQFVSSCNSKDETEVISLGNDVKNLISNPQCNLPDFVTSFLQSSDASDVAKGYCEFVGRIEDDSRICSNYSMVLSEFKSGNLKQLPCPPSSCTTFQNIKPPKCVVAQRFCEDGSTDKGCISKPKKDLFCLKVPDELAESNCADDNTGNSNDIQPNWIVATSAEGNNYCVPSNSDVISKIKIFSKTFSSSKDIAQECEYNFCHRQCDKKSNSDVKDCHFNCDVKLGRIIDCTDGNSPYFSIQCCGHVKIKSRIASKSAYQLASSGSVRPASLAVGKGTVVSDVASCLCNNSNNFNEIGYAYDEVKSACKEECPSGYEVDEESGSCFPICPKSSVRDPNGFCKKGCPLDLPYLYGKACVAVCPDSLTPQRSSDGILACLCSDGSSPDSNGKCSGTSQNYCSPSIAVGTGSPPCSCNPAGGTFVGSNNQCQCSGNLTYTKEYGCGGTTTTNNCPSPYIKDPAYANQCKCPESTPYELGTNCVTSCPAGFTPTITPATAYSNTRQSCKCSDGTYPNSQGTCSTSSTHTCTPGEVSTAANPCTCASGATVGSAGYCQCTNGQTYTATGCGTTTNYCSPGITVGTNSCTCNPSGGAYNSNGYCTCPSGSSTAYTAATGCGTSTTRTCDRNESYSSSNPCKCATGASFSVGNVCQCQTISELYANTGCFTPAINFSKASVADDYLRTISDCLNCSNGVTSDSLNAPTCYELTKSPSKLTLTICSTGSIKYFPLLTVKQNLGDSISVGDQLKLCLSVNQNVCSNTITVTDGCPTGKVFDPSTSKCVCPQGQVQDPNNANGCITPQTISLTSASIAGNNLTLSYTKGGFNECVLIVGSSGTIFHNGVNSYGLLCSASGGTSTNNLNNFLNISPGSQIKLCKGNGTDVITNTSLSTSSLCSSLVTVTTNDTITLTSVVRATNGDLSVTYSKNFSDCVGLKQNNIDGLKVTSQNQFCGTSGTETVTASALKSSVQAGTQVALCNDVSRFCSQPIAITAAPRIILNSTVLNSGVITFNFTKDTSDCFKLYTSDGTLLNIPNHCFGAATGVGYPTSTLNTTLASGTQVKICYLSEPSVCSQLVPASGN